MKFLCATVRSVSPCRPRRRAAWPCLVLAVLLALATEWAAAAETETVNGRPVVRIAYTQFPPIEYQDQHGQAAGSIIELTRKVAREAGYEPRFELLPVSRIYLYLKNGTIDLWPGLTNIPELEGQVLESWASPLTVQLSAWFEQGTPAPAQLGDLRGRTLIVIGGYTYGGLLQWLVENQQVRVTEAPNHRSAMDMLKRGRGDYVLDYREPVREILSAEPARGLQEVRIRERDAAWLYSLASPRAAILREAFDDAFLRLVQKGEIPPNRVAGPSYSIPGFPPAYR